MMETSPRRKGWTCIAAAAVILCVALWMLVFSRGRISAHLFSLPYSLPGEVIVTDADTSEPLSGALVLAEWWCHDNPLPDAPGSFFVTSETVTDENGRATPAVPDERGGWFGCSLAVTISKPGYVPAGILVDPSNYPLPESEASWPFRMTTVVPGFTETLAVSLIPALPVYLSALTDDDPLVRSVAAEELGKLPVEEEERDEVIRALTDALDDPDAEVRRYAAWAIEEMGHGDR
jgi:hypothetical protein